MKTYQTITVKEERLDRIVCNGCGEEIRKDRFGYFEEHIAIEKTWGYGSPYDGETHAFELCGECYQKMLAAFKISPERQP